MNADFEYMKRALNAASHSAPHTPDDCIVNLGALLRAGSLSAKQIELIGILSGYAKLGSDPKTESYGYVSGIASTGPSPGTLAHSTAQRNADAADRGRGKYPHQRGSSVPRSCSVGADGTHVPARPRGPVPTTMQPLTSDQGIHSAKACTSTSHYGGFEPVGFMEAGKVVFSGVGAFRDGCMEHNVNGYFSATKVGKLTLVRADCDRNTNKHACRFAFASDPLGKKVVRLADYTNEQILLPTDPDILTQAVSAFRGYPRTDNTDERMEKLLADRGISLPGVKGAGRGRSLRRARGRGRGARGGGDGGGGGAGDGGGRGRGRGGDNGDRGGRGGWPWDDKVEGHPDPSPPPPLRSISPASSFMDRSLFGGVGRALQDATEVATAMIAGRSSAVTIEEYEPKVTVELLQQAKPSAETREYYAQHKARIDAAAKKIAGRVQGFHVTDALPLLVAVIMVDAAAAYSLPPVWQGEYDATYYPGVPCGLAWEGGKRTQVYCRPDGERVFQGVRRERISYTFAASPKSRGRGAQPQQITPDVTDPCLAYEVPVPMTSWTYHHPNSWGMNSLDCGAGSTVWCQSEPSNNLYRPQVNCTGVVGQLRVVMGCGPGMAGYARRCALISGDTIKFTPDGFCRPTDQYQGAGYQLPGVFFVGDMVMKWGVVRGPDSAADCQSYFFWSGSNAVAPFTGVPGVDALVPTASPVAVPVGVPVAVPVGVPAGVPVANPVAVPIGVPAGVPVGVPVGVPTGVAVGVPVASPMAVPVGVPVAIPVGVPVGVPVQELVTVPAWYPVAVPLAGGCPALTNASVLEGVVQAYAGSLLWTMPAGEKECGTFCRVESCGLQVARVPCVGSLSVSVCLDQLSSAPPPPTVAANCTSYVSSVRCSDFGTVCARGSGNASTCDPWCHSSLPGEWRCRVPPSESWTWMSSSDRAGCDHRVLDLVRAWMLGRCWSELSTVEKVAGATLGVCALCGTFLFVLCATVVVAAALQIISTTGKVCRWSLKINRLFPLLFLVTVASMVASAYADEEVVGVGGSLQVANRTVTLVSAVEEARYRLTGWASYLQSEPVPAEFCDGPCAAAPARCMTCGSTKGPSLCFSSASPDVTPSPTSTLCLVANAGAALPVGEFVAVSLRTRWRMCSPVCSEFDSVSSMGGVPTWPGFASQGLPQGAWSPPGRIVSQSFIPVGEEVEFDTIDGLVAVTGTECRLGQALYEESCLTPGSDHLPRKVLGLSAALPSLLLDIAIRESDPLPKIGQPLNVTAYYLSPQVQAWGGVSQGVLTVSVTPSPTDAALEDVGQRIQPVCEETVSQTLTVHCWNSSGRLRFRREVPEVKVVFNPSDWGWGAEHRLCEPNCTLALDRTVDTLTGFSNCSNCTMAVVCGGSPQFLIPGAAVVSATAGSCWRSGASGELDRVNVTDIEQPGSAFDPQTTTAAVRACSGRGGSECSCRNSGYRTCLTNESRLGVCEPLGCHGDLGWRTGVGDCDVVCPAHLDLLWWITSVTTPWVCSGVGAKGVVALSVGNCTLLPLSVARLLMRPLPTLSWAAVSDYLTTASEDVFVGLWALATAAGSVASNLFVVLLLVRAVALVWAGARVLSWLRRRKAKRRYEPDIESASPRRRRNRASRN